MRKLLLITAALTALAAPAIAATTGGGTTCVRHNDIYNWKAIDDKHIVVENTRHQKVLLKLIGTCQDLRFRQTIAFRNVGGFGLDCISTGDDVLVRNFGSGTGRCAVVDVSPYTGAPTATNSSHNANSANDHSGDHHTNSSY